MLAPVEPLIDLAPGAEDNPLATSLVSLIRESIENDPRRRRSFLALKSTVLVVPFDTGDALTLRFDLGRLAVHDGNIGVPSVTIGVPSADLSALANLRLPRFEELVKSPLAPRPDEPEPFSDRRGSISQAESMAPSGRGRASVVEALRLFASGEVKVYGLLAHPRTVYRLLRLLSPPAVKTAPKQPGVSLRSLLGERSLLGGGSLLGRALKRSSSRGNPS
jgi:hypothetical protein